MKGMRRSFSGLEGPSGGMDSFLRFVVLFPRGQLWGLLETLRQGWGTSSQVGSAGFVLDAPAEGQTGAHCEPECVSPALHTASHTARGPHGTVPSGPRVPSSGRLSPGSTLAVRLALALHLT